MALLDRLAELDAARLATLWVVGGCVRDRLLGRESNDIDLIVVGAVEFARDFARRTRCAFVLLDDGRGTARVVDRDGAYLDFCEPQGSLDEDLRARDFTLNAIACPLADWLAERPAWLDPTGGLDDLAHGRLRATGPEVFAADPLRILRGHRLAAALDLAPDEATLTAMGAALPGLRQVAAERIRVEWLAWLGLPTAPAELLRAARLGTVGQLLPEAPSDLAEVLDRGERALALVCAEPALSAWCAEPEMVALARFAMLLPAADQPPCERELGRRFALSRHERRRLTVARGRLGSLAGALQALDLEVAGLLVGAAARGALTVEQVGGALRRLVEELLPRWSQPPLVTGWDLQSTLGYTPSPKFKACLDQVRLEQLEGRLDDPAAALARAREMMESDG